LLGVPPKLSVGWLLSARILLDQQEILVQNPFFRMTGKLAAGSSNLDGQDLPTPVVAARRTSGVAADAAAALRAAGQLRRVPAISGFSRT